MLPTEPFVAPNVTDVPLTLLPYWSVTRTTILDARVVPTVAVWLLPETSARFFATSGFAVAENGTGEPESPVTVAEADCPPATVPSVQVVEATPLAFVATGVLPTEPEPAANVTFVPLTPLPY